MKSKTLQELVTEVVGLYEEDALKEIEEFVRVLHERGKVSRLTLAVSHLAMGYSLLRPMELSQEAQAVVQAAAFRIGLNVMTIEAERAAELTDEQRAAARRLGARIPKIGKA